MFSGLFFFIHFANYLHETPKGDTLLYKDCSIQIHLKTWFENCTGDVSNHECIDC